MAEKNTQHCALCGKELGALSVTTIRCGLINQMVCSSCEKRYTGAVLEEKVRLLEEMERTGYLTRPEEFRSFLEQFRARVEKLRNTCTWRPHYLWGYIKDAFELTDQQMIDYFGEQPPLEPDAE